MHDPANAILRPQNITTRGRSSSAPLSHYLFSALPHLLVGTILCILESGMLTRLLAVDPIWSLGVVGVIVLAAGVSLILALLKARRENWPAWWGAWLTYLGMVFLCGVLGLVSVLKLEDWLNRYNIFVLMIAGSVAIGLFFATRYKPMHGLLASLTVVAFTGLPTFEFVPSDLRAWITGFVWFCLAIFSVVIIGIGRVRNALWVGLLGSAFILLPYAWVGIFHGGMLDIRVPGASWLQVLRIFLPYLSLAGCLIFGPQLAWHINFFGEDGDYFGIWRSRFALLGQAVMLMGAVVLYWDYMSSNFDSFAILGLELLAVGCVFFCLGYVMVIYSTNVDFSRLWAVGMFVSLFFLPPVLLNSLPGWIQSVLQGANWTPIRLTYYPEILFHVMAIFWTFLTLAVLRFSPKMKRVPPARKSASARL